MTHSTHPTLRDLHRGPVHDESPRILLLDLLLGVTIGVLSACVAVLVAVS